MVKLTFANLVVQLVDNTQVPFGLPFDVSASVALTEQTLELTMSKLQYPPLTINADGDSDIRLTLNGMLLSNPGGCSGAEVSSLKSMLTHHCFSHITFFKDCSTSGYHSERY